LHGEYSEYIAAGAENVSYEGSSTANQEKSITMEK
jgi:hypothetical protein